MIYGIGIDIIEIDRIRRAIHKNERFIDRVLTLNENKVFTQLKKERRKLEFISGRFAAKEAFSKATGRGIGKLSFHDIEILPGKQGAPMITVTGYVSEKIFVTISHSREYAVAQVLITE